MARMSMEERLRQRFENKPEPGASEVVAEDQEVRNEESIREGLRELHEAVDVMKGAIEDWKSADGISSDELKIDTKARSEAGDAKYAAELDVKEKVALVRHVFNELNNQELNDEELEDLDRVMNEADNTERMATNVMKPVEPTRKAA